MDLVQLANFYLGYDFEPGPIEAGRADRHISAALTVPRATIIWLSHYNFIKIGLKHRDVTYADYARLPDILTFGFIAKSHRRSIAVCLPDPVRSLRVILKATPKNEVFVLTLLPIGLHEARRLHRQARKRGMLLRDLGAELARLLDRAS